jgi:hypothetical protein
MLISYKGILDKPIDDFIDQNNFSDAVKRLIEIQKTTWPALESGINSLKLIKTKSINFDGFSFEVQYNPGRYISSAALVDEISIKARKCFLCLENLPKEQEGIIVKNYILLANPFPIFQEHITISNLEHLDQRIEDSFEDFIFFIEKLSNHFSVFYNGPLCGASAPDHLHFQAGRKNSMPIESEIVTLKSKYGEEISSYNTGCEVTFIDDKLRKIVLFESREKQNLLNSFYSFYRIYSSKSDLIEPMMNILGLYEKEIGWRILVMLRAKHRPEAFYKEGGKRILYSPAASDYGGLCITPLETDYVKFNKELLKDIFTEVSLTDDLFYSLKGEMKSTK